MQNLLSEKLSYVNLGDFCEFRGGKQPSKITFKYKPENGYVRLLQIRDFSKREEPVYVNSNNNLTYVEEDDILIARYGASVGKILTGKKGAINVAIMKAEPKNGLLKRYLYYFLNDRKFQSYITSIPGRMAQAGFDKEVLEKVKIPLPFKNNHPDFEEQKRIVDKIDQLFSEINEGVEKTKIAFENAQNLLQSELTKVFECGLRNNWKEERFVDHVKIFNGYSFKSNDYKSAGVPLIRIGDIKDNIVVLNKCEFLPEKFKDIYKNFILERGDLLIALSGATTGKIGRYIQNDSALLNQRVGKIVPSDRIDIDYVYYFFLSDYSQKQVLELSKGAAQPNLTDKTTQRLKMRIPFKNNQPDIEEQKQTVRKFRDIQDAANTLGDKYQEQLDDFAKLKQSILNQAFQGKL